MRPSHDCTTPEKKRPFAPKSPPDAPLKKRNATTNAPTTDPLLLIFKDGHGGIALYCSNHVVLSEIRGHYGEDQTDEFLSDELFEGVLAVVGGGGYSSVNRELLFADEIFALKKASLLKLFSQEIYGGDTAEMGQVFRGTIVV